MKSYKFQIEGDSVYLIRKNGKEGKSFRKSGLQKTKALLIANFEKNQAHKKWVAKLQKMSFGELTSQGHIANTRVKYGRVAIDVRSAYSPTG